jgi:hypothetical protein
MHLPRRLPAALTACRCMPDKLRVTLVSTAGKNHADYAFAEGDRCDGRSALNRRHFTRGKGLLADIRSSTFKSNYRPGLIRLPSTYFIPRNLEAPWSAALCSRGFCHKR